MFFMRFFWKKTQPPSGTSIQRLVEVLDSGVKEELEKSLWQPKNIDLIFLPLTFDMILKLKRPENYPQPLSVYKTLSNKNFTLIIFNTPWANSDLKFLPIIIENNSIKIVGVMLPFNELLPLITNKQNKEISDLGMKWTGFALENRFNLKL